MTKNSATVTPIDVIGENAHGLAAAYDGLYHLFGVRVSSWEIEDGALVAMGVTCNPIYSLDTILTDVNRKNRRAPLWPTAQWLLDPEFVPAPFTDNLSITTFMVQYFAGSTGESNSRSAQYVKDAAAAYKDATGTRVKRGPKVRTINLKNLGDINAERLTNAGASRADILHLMEVAQAALDATPEETQEEVVTES
jgi:hypothetical protein